MVDIIGNSFDGLGIIPSSKIIKGGYRTIIGNGSGLFRRFLGFDKGVFANASERYITAENPTTGLYSITGPFGANVLATRNIGSYEYGQFEKQYTAKNTYSDQLENVFTIQTRTTWSSNAINDPLDNLVADKLRETADTGTHFTYANIAGTIGTNLMVIKAKAGERSVFRFRTDGVASYIILEYDLSVPSVSVIHGSVIREYSILPMEDDWFLCWFTFDSTVSTSAARYIYLVSGGTDSYAGTLNYGMYFTHFNLSDIDIISSYVKTEASPVTKSPDYFYFPSAVVPTWMKSKFTTKLIPNYDIPYTTKNKPIWSFNKTAQTLATGYGSHGLIATTNYLYWCDYNNGIIYRSGLDGSSRTSLATGLTTPSSITIQGSTLYFIQRTVGKISSIPIGGGSVTDVYIGETDPFGIASDATYLYWTDVTNGSVRRAPLSPGLASNLIIGLSAPTGLSVDATYIYLNNTGTNSVTRYLLDGTSAVSMATSISYPVFNTNDDNFIYVAAFTGGIIHCINKNTKTKTSLISQAEAIGVAVLSGSVFWSSTQSSGTLKRRDSVTAWLTTSGTIKVVDGPTTMIETSAVTASMHQNVEVEFDRENGKITLSGFTTGDGAYTDTAWTSPDGFNIEYGCALGGSTDFDGLVSAPIG